MNSSLSSWNFLTTVSSWLTLSKCALLISFFAALVLLPGLEHRPKFHPDEVKWTEASIFTFTNFLEGSESAPEIWKQSLDTYGVQNPLLGKLLIGASLHLGGYRTFSKMPEWNWKRSVEWHRVQGRLPEARKLYYARLPVALASACFLGIIAYLAGIAAGYLDGTKPQVSVCLLVAALGLAHPLFLTYSRRVGLDIFALLFTAAAVLCVVQSMRARLDTCSNGFQWRSFVWYITACLTASLAVNAKLNGALALVFVGVCRILVLTQTGITTSYRNRIREFIYGVITLLLIVMAVTYLLTPLARNEPVRVIEEWNNLNSIVQEVYTKWFPKRAINTFQDRLAGFAKNALFVGCSPRSIGSYLGFTSVLIFFSTLLFKFRDDRARDISQVFGLWLIITAVALLKWVPLDRPRYYLPFFPLLIISASYSLKLVFASLFRWYQRRNERPQSS